MAMNGCPLKKFPRVSLIRQLIVPAIFAARWMG
jgi:hypothetical protein